MKKIVLSAMPWFVLGACVQADASVQLTAPQAKPGTYADTYSGQVLGRVIASSDGRFILYEWARPYLNWTPDTKWMASSAARRRQTFLFKADLTGRDPTSEYLFYPNAGCTYWLSELSPDNKNLVLFELDHDNRRVRAGVWNFDDKKIRWFAPRPDEGKIEDSVAWISNDEFIFPVKDSKSAMVRASVVSYEAEPCTSCGPETLRQVRADAKSSADHAREVASHLDRAGIAKDAQLIAGSANGSLAVYLRDDKDVLSLIYKEADQAPKVLFENVRRWEAFKVPQTPTPVSPK